jgi:hypothetical protein
VSDKNHPKRPGIVIAAVLALAGISALDTDARTLPFTLTKHSVSKGRPVPIGDLQVQTLNPAPPSDSQGDRETLERCVQEGPEWFRWSDDGTTLELDWFSTARDRVLAAYCADGVILVGGYEARQIDEDPSRRRAWLFSMVRAHDHGPVRVFFDDTYLVGEPPREIRYTLNELRSIDPAAGQMVFSGTSEIGKRALLRAPFVVEE